MASVLNNLQFQTQVVWSEQQANAFGNTVNASNFNPSTGTFGIGTGAGNVNKLWIAQGTISASASISYTLDNSSLTDPVGNAVNFTKIKGIWFENLVVASNTASSITFAATVSNSCFAWNVPVNQGGRLIWVDPVSTANLPVTVSTADVLKITNADGANTGSFRFLLAGE